MARIRVQGERVEVTGLDPLALNDLRQDAPEPAGEDSGGLRASPSNLLYLLERLPEAVWSDPQGRLMEARALRLIDRSRRYEPTPEDRDWPFKIPPREFQLNIHAQARGMPVAALAPVAPGTGKTKMAIDITAAQFLDGEIDGVALIAAPKGVPRQWLETALPEHMTEAVRWDGAVWSPTRKTPQDVTDRHSKRMRWLAFNVEAFSTESGKGSKALEAFLKSGRMALVWDESSRGKNPRAARTKAILKLAPLAARRMILSGTPITKGIEDLWSQYQFLDPGILGMSNYYAFRARYCVTAPAYRGAGVGAVKIVGYRNTEEFVRKIAGVTFVVPKDVLGLPEKTYEELPVELTREQRMAYNALRNELVDDLQNLRIASPVNAAVRLVRLQQVLCGRIYTQTDVEEPPKAEAIPSHRLETLIEYVEANPAPKVIWARFRADIEEIALALQKIGRSPVTYYGGISDEQRANRKKAFVNGFATDFVANPATGGMGLDGLQLSSSHAIYYSSDFNRENRWQSEDRIHRIGMRGTALYTDMVVPNSVDRMILQSYKETEDLVRSIMSRPELVPTL